MTLSERTVARLGVDGPTVGLAAQFGVLLVLAVGVGLGPAGWLAGTGYAVVTWLLLGRALRRSGAAALGPANRVTLTRATLVGGVTALVADSFTGRTPVVVLVVLAAVALALDGVDGQVARRTGSTSALGARFDMEVDAFLILVLSVFVARPLGWWVLAIGAFRYAFAAAFHVLPWLGADLPTRLSRKTVAAVQGVVLAGAAAGVLPPGWTALAVGLALASLCWSFGRDIGWLWRARHRSHRGPAGTGWHVAPAQQWLTPGAVPELFTGTWVAAQEHGLRAVGATRRLVVLRGGSSHRDAEPADARAA